jgi:hypothetical protein
MDKETLSQVFRILDKEWKAQSKDADKLATGKAEKAIVAYNVGRADGIQKAMMIIESLA